MELHIFGLDSRRTLIDNFDQFVQRLCEEINDIQGKEYITPERIYVILQPTTIILDSAKISAHLYYYQVDFSEEQEQRLCPRINWVLRGYLKKSEVKFEYVQVSAWPYAKNVYLE